MSDNKYMPIFLIVAIIVIISGGVFAYLLLDDSDDDKDSSSEQANQEEQIEEIPEPSGQEDNLKNIVETAIDNEELSTLVAAVQAGDLVEALSDENVELTVFAPTNSAFEDIQSTVDTLLLQENLADLQDVLTYHVISGKVMASDLSDGMVVETLNGESLEVSITDGIVYINDSMVIIQDIETSNGVVHVIDTVLVP